MLKTHQATAKRFRLTRTGKIEKRRAGQDHFNARESGKVGRHKRHDVIMPATERRVVAAALPHA
ncbi:MAG: 50S ribosomal protein L35 [Candidatus Magasanikbacteria bacterium]|nr:50S ribosomal protein L35 [Candidatus Magasanikbacteria bacterium]